MLRRWNSEGHVESRHDSREYTREDVQYNNNNNIFSTINHRNRPERCPLLLNI